MKKRRKYDIEENLESLHLAKLINKYDRLGYKIYPNHRSRRTGVIADLYVYNPETKDKIIFEIKARKAMSKGDIEAIVNQRIAIKKAFPGARIKLVVAEDFKEPITDYSILNIYILNFIRGTYIEYLHKHIEGFVELYDVDNLEYDQIQLNDFSKINLVGTGNLRFVIRYEYSENQRRFSGESLSDGIPFSFNLKLELNNKIYYPPISSDIYRISNRSEISFDLSEFAID